MELNQILYRWLNIQKYEKVLIVCEEENRIVEVNSAIDVITLEQLETYLQKDLKKKYDLIVAIYVLEQFRDPVHILKLLKTLLSIEGLLYIGTYNRLALSSFCGEPDPFTGKCFSGLENYKESNFCVREKRCYARNELENILNRAGLAKSKFYSVYPNIIWPQHIITDEYIPKEVLSNRYTPLYNNSDTIIMQEEKIIDTIAQNHMLSLLANNYLIEYKNQGDLSDVLYTSISYDRGKDRAMCLEIKNGERVEKRALYNEGVEKLRTLYNNMQAIKKRGLYIIEGELQNDVYVMPYINAPTGDMYLQELAKYDQKKFIEKMDEFRELILQSSEIVEENQYGYILSKGYMDLVPLNSFVIEDKFYFYDQEFCFANIPANVIILRAVVIVYQEFKDIDDILPRKYFMERYHLQENWRYYDRITSNFIVELRNKKKLMAFNSIHTRNEWITEYNKNMLENNDFYDKYKTECFNGMKGKRIIVFGAGKYAKKFIAFYKYDYQIDKIIDNDNTKWGENLDGVLIDTPESIMEEKGDYRVIICTKFYEAIFKQLKAMKVTDIGIYDAYRIYPGRQAYFPNNVPANITCHKDKQYHVGYISGVFDLFHIGHVNILRKAKEQCDYLIVAVTSDEYVRTKKNREPYIPFEERIEILRACRYVDEVAGVPFEFAGTVEAFQKYHFDVQFCGSDYINDPWWLKQKEWLEEHGATLHFFPYTEQTSSTKIKALIEKNLL